MKREFTAAAPNRLWVTDLTFVPYVGGVAYVCIIIDVFNRMIVGWRCASHMRTDMVLDAIEIARWSRGTHHEDLRCHSDAGSQVEFKWLSQHHHKRGVFCRQQSRDNKRVVVGNGMRIEHSGRECGLPVGQRSRWMSSAAFGG